MDLMRVLGCGVEIKDKRIKTLGAFDLDNLNWSKVIICTDADVDGYHIRTLILTISSNRTSSWTCCGFSVAASRSPTGV